MHWSFSFIPWKCHFLRLIGPPWPLWLFIRVRQNLPLIVDFQTFHGINTIIGLLWSPWIFIWGAPCLHWALYSQISLSRGHISNHHQLLHMHQAPVTNFYVFFVKYSLYLGGSVLKTFSTPTWNIPSFLEVLSWRLFLGECWCSKLPPLNLLPINCPN